MPIIDIPNYGPVSFPDDMPPEEVQARAQYIADKKASTLEYNPDYRNLGLGRILSNSFNRSMSGLGSTLTEGLPALVGSALGYDEFAERKLGEAQATRAAAEEKYPTAFKSYKDVDGAGNAIGYGVETIGEVGPDILAMLTGAGVVGMGAKRAALSGINRLAAERAAAKGLTGEAATDFTTRFAQKAGAQAVPDAKELGKNLGIYGSSFGLNAPDTFQGIYEETGNLEPGIATAFGAAQAALDSIIPARLLSQFSPATRAKVASEIVNRSTIVPPSIKMGLAKSLAATVGMEAGTESTQELLSILAEKTAGAKGDVFSPENIDRLLEAGIKGGIGGGVLGTPGAIAESVYAKRTAQEELARRKAEAAAAAAPPTAPVAPATPTPALSSTVPPDQLAAALQQVTAPAAPVTPPVPTVEPDGRPTPPPEGVPATPINPQFVAMVQKWNDANLASTLKKQLAKTPEGQNKPLIAAIQAEIAKRSTAQGAENVVPSTAETGQPEVPVAPPVGESVGVVSEPGTAAAPGGVGVSEPAGVVPTGIPPVGPDVREGSVPPALETPPIAGYKTAKGSTYVVFEDGTTQRDKAPRPEHPGDVGLKERSAKTIYVDGDASRLSAAGVENMEGARVILGADGTASLVWKNPKTGKLGSSPTSSKIPYYTEPAVGRSPLELWQPRDDVQGHEAYAGMHAGNKIAEITPKKETPPAVTEPTPVVTEPTPVAVTKPKLAKPKKPIEPKAEKPVVEKEPQDELERQRAAEKKAVTDRFQEVVGEGYEKNKDVRENVSLKDEEVVHNLITSKEGRAKENKDAEAYFSKVPQIVDALHNIAFDLVNEAPRFRKAGERAIEAKFFEGTGGKSAEAARDWVQKNLGTTANEQFKKFIAQEEKIAKKSQKTLEEYLPSDVQRAKYEKALQRQLTKEAKEATADAAKEARAARKKITVPEEVAPDETDLDIEDWLQSKDRLFSEITSPFASPLHPVIRQALYNGQLQQALKFLAEHGNDRTRELANVFAKVTADVNVRTVHKLTDSSGKPVAGYYDPVSNTIVLDSEVGMNTHTLFHELSHAATSHVLANPSHPVTKQLTKLFNEVKGSLDTEYGAQSLDEFVAETWANDEFKAKLNSLNYNGSPISAWQRFMHTIRNLFRTLMGKESVPLESAYTVADNAIKAILSPAPNYRDGTALYAAVLNPRDPKISSWLNEGVNALEQLPGMTPERADAVHEFVRSAGRLAKKMLFAVMPLDTMVDIAKKYIPNAPLINELVNMRKGDEYTRNQRIESVCLALDTWAKSVSQTVIDRFNEVIYSSTVEGVDPTRPRQFYVDKFSKDVKEQAEALANWDKLNKELTSLGPQAVRMYNLMKNNYASLRKEIIASMEGRVDETVEDPVLREKFKNELLKKIVEKGEIDPYFPLTRNGKFWLSYNAPTTQGTTETYIEAFEGERERERRLEILKDAGATDLQKFAKLSELNYKNVPNTAFVHGVLNLMEMNRPEGTEAQKNYDEAMEQIMRMYLSTMPETAFAKSFAARQGVLGFRKDSIRALREKSFSISRQISNMKYAAMLNKARSEMLRHVKELGKSGKAEDNQLAKEYFDELSSRVDFAKSPTVSMAANILNTISFTTLLGFNVSSALVNLSQMPLIVMPYLGGKYGYEATRKAITEASLAYMGSGGKRNVEMLGSKDEKLTRTAMPSMDNIDFDGEDIPKHLRKYKALVEFGRKMGQFNRSQMSDVLEAEDSASPLARVNAASGFFMHQGERMNREVSLMAAYDLELQRLSSPKATKEEKALSTEEKQQAAARQALYLTELVNGGTAAAAAPPIAQNAVGRVLWMFKSYGVKMNYLLFKTAREALKGESPEVRSAAFKQLGGIMGQTALFAGLQGMPMFGVVSMIYNLFKEDDEEDFGAVVRGATGETVYKGLINSLTGLTVAERIGLSNLIFKESPVSSGSSTLVDSLAQLLGGPFIGVVTRMERGISQLQDGQVERGLESMSPVALANIMKGIRFATEGANTLRGDPIMGDVSAWNAGAQMLGFTPAEYTKELEINAVLKGIEKSVGEGRSKQLQKLNIATKVGDYEGAAEAYEKLQKLYEKHPDLGNLNDTITRSRRAFNNAKVVNGIILAPGTQKELMALRDELEGEE